MCYSFGRGNDTVACYWLLRQWEHRALLEGRQKTAGRLWQYYRAIGDAIYLNWKTL